MSPTRALIIGRDAGPLAEAVRRVGLDAGHTETGEDALQLVERFVPDIIILDIAHGDTPNLQLLGYLSGVKRVRVIAVVESAGVRAAVRAMRAGAIDVIDHATPIIEVEHAIRSALLYVAVQGYEDTFGGSPRMEGLRSAVARLATLPIPVLIRGECGVGKEFVAEAIHRLAARPAGPFVKLKLTALPTDRVIGEIDRLSAAAAGGTIFFDDIGDASDAAQSRLLDAMTAAGETLRVMAATTADMDRLVTSGAFRRDLYERFAQATIDVPPLRERREEITALSRRFLERFAHEYQRPIPLVSEAMAELLRSYDWPGNVRELESVVKRWVVLGSEDRVRAEIVARQAAARRRQTGRVAGRLGLLEIGRSAAREAERVALQDALLRARGNRAAAARELRVSYRTLLQKLTETGLIPVATGKRPKVKPRAGAV